MKEWKDGRKQVGRIGDRRMEGWKDGGRKDGEMEGSG